MSRQFGHSFIKLFFICLHICEGLAKLVRGLRVLLNRLQHLRNVVPEASLVRFQGLISLNQLFIKLVGQLRQLVLKSSDLFEKLLICEFLVTYGHLNFALLFRGLLLHIFLDIRDLGHHFVSKLAYNFL